MDAQTWAIVLSLASLSIVTTVAGVGLAVLVGARHGAVAVGIGFSAGVMVAVSTWELLPEAYQEGDATGVTVAALLGVATLAGLHVVIPHTHLVDEDSGVGAENLRSAYLVAFGLILHDFPEGFALANSYASTPRLGVLVAIAIAMHNVPEEFAMAVPAARLQRRRFLVRAAVVSASAEPAGAVIGLAGVSLYPGLNAVFLAFAAGAMVYVSFHELYPMARRLGRLRLFAAGACLAAATTAALHFAIPA